MMIALAKKVPQTNGGARWSGTNTTRRRGGGGTRGACDASRAAAAIRVAWWPGSSDPSHPEEDRPAHRPARARLAPGLRQTRRDEARRRVAPFLLVPLGGGPALQESHELRELPLPPHLESRRIEFL